MTVDKTYCMSSFLMYRTIADRSKCFSEKLLPTYYPGRKAEQLHWIHNSSELETALREITRQICSEGRKALALSGGIDSAILAKFMPKGSIAYTFRCVVPGKQVTDESQAAAKYAEECGLEHRVVEVYWEDYEKYVPELMKHKGSPIHSIEVQIYKAGLQALKDGNDGIIYGESSDVNYGGQSGLLSRDWTVGEFADRYSYVRPYHVLKESDMIMDPISQYEKDGIVDVHEFDRNVYFTESMGSYTNACDLAGIPFYAPFSDTMLAEPLDLKRVRSGENKYLVREVFNRLYPSYMIPEKIPMPRPMDEWFKDWKGPVRKEFWPNCTRNMTGDQKYYVWVLEQFLNLIDSCEH